MDSKKRNALLLLCLMPLFFSSNIVFGRATVPTVEPWTLAFLRWSLAFVVLLPFCGRSITAHKSVFIKNWKLLTLLGFLGMWICGAIVYLALRHTTATNGTLIYTTTPIMILLLEWQFRGRAISIREIVGVACAVIGVFVIVSQGSLTVLTQFQFNFGDLLFLGSAFSFAVYSVLLKRSEFNDVPTITLFSVVCLAGALTLLPFFVGEVLITEQFPTDRFQWTNIAGIVVISSIFAFLSYQYGVKIVGPAVTGLFMYLMPAFGVGLAVLFLGERLEDFHIAGSALIMFGLVLATLPKDMIRGRARTPV
ncbi:MAG: EamA family transporter [Stappiaceae bacterium]